MLLNSVWLLSVLSLDKVYRNASALVITFSVNNYLDPVKNGPALAWETKFIEFMKNYTKDHPDVEIAFSSEVTVDLLSWKWKESRPNWSHYKAV